MTLNASQFDRIGPGRSVDILDECWVTHFSGINIDLGDGFFPAKSLTLYCAGNSFGPNKDSLKTSLQAVEEFGAIVSPVLHALHEVDADADYGCRQITVPYQFVRIYFLFFNNDFGCGKTYAIKIDDCVYGKKGVYELGAPELSIGAIPGRVRGVLDHLGMPFGDFALTDLLQKITAHEIMGPEIVDELLGFIQINADRLERSEWMETLLTECQQFLKAANSQERAG